MKRFIYILIILIILALIGFTLYNNRQEMQEEVQLAERTVDVLPVEVATVQSTPLTTTVEAAGVLAPAAELMLTAEAQGRVLAIYKKEGASLQKGEVLAKVDDAMIRTELEVARANLEKAQKDLQRFRNLAAGEAVTPQQLEQIQLQAESAEARVNTLQSRLSDTNIKTPVQGTLNQLMIETGSMVGAGSPVAEIVDVSQLKLNVKVTGTEVLNINPGQEVQVMADIYPGRVLTGVVQHVAVKADRSLQYPVEISLTNPGEIPLKAGMYATARFVFEEENPSLVIGRNAIVGSLQDAEVFVVDNATAQLRQVTVGKVVEEQVEILEGLQAGDTVVISGQFNLRDGMAVRVVE
jgi:RND family efflux transporter MFP subunit